MSPAVQSVGLGAGADAGADFGADYSIYVLPIVTLLGFLIPALYLFPPVPASKTDALIQTHQKLGLPKSQSNLRDQFAPRHKGAPGASATPSAKLQALVVYPVKSCRGIEVSRSRVFPTGLEFDRLYTFAQLRSRFPLSADAKDGDEDDKDHTWHFVTQRQFPLLANVKVDVWVPRQKKGQSAASGESGHEAARDEQAWIILRFPWKELGFRGLLQTLGAKLDRGWRAVAEKEVLLPVAFPSKADIKEHGYQLEKVKIWNEVITALNMTADLPRELMLYLGVSNKLGIFRSDPGRLREVYRCAPRKAEAGYQPQVGFQDAYPLHMMTLGSLQEFDSVTPKDETLEKLDVARFRSNIILSGSPAYDEETWKNVSFRPGKSSLTANADFHVSCRTVRCTLPNVDPATGLRHKTQPDQSLRKLRNVDSGAPKYGCLGMQMVPLFEDATTTDVDDLRSWLEVGMDVEVLQRGEHTYIPQ